jgi:hypothetical protein
MAHLLVVVLSLLLYERPADDSTTCDSIAADVGHQRDPECGRDHQRGQRHGEADETAG